MTLGFAKILPASAARSAVPLSQPPRQAELPEAVLLPAEVVDAARRAERIVAEAQARAAQIRSHSEAELARLRTQVVDDARANGVARLAVDTLALAARDADSDERTLKRSVELARLLAERLLSEALSLDPSLIESVARRALAEASGARRIRIVAHPDDAPYLQSALEAGRLAHVSEVLSDPSRSRNSLRFESEIGTLEADIAPQLDRLADRLQQALQHER
ncbi:MAG: FliH/SctL family protein [Polyangiaceae bacterium]